MIQVNGDRLWARIHEIARFGATPAGGCNRQALTDADFLARAAFTKWAERAGCSVRIDSIGNIFVRRAGADSTLPAVLTGSHLDTQPTGGRFDGIYGVLAGLEVIEALNDAGFATRHPFEVAVWCNEEGCRFPAAMMGSAVWASRMPIEQAYRLQDSTGTSVKDALEARGLVTSDRCEQQPIRAAFEAHIEQGPILERGRHMIGVVLGVQGMRRYEVVINGQEAHAGPTPMADRKDPVRGLADLLPALYALTDRFGPDARLTIGIIEVVPGSPNTVPGRVRFTLDVRHADEGQYLALLQGAEAAVTASLSRSALTGSIRRVWESAPVRFDAACVDAVRNAAQALGYSWTNIVSGAGHDSVNIARVVPTSMIFVPCKNGLSHNEAEDASKEDVVAGANVLLHAMLAVDTP